MAVVMSSELFAANRMDAGYFIVLRQYASDIEQAKARYSADEAKALLKSLPLNRTYLRDLLCLGRGSVAANDARGILRIIEEYPLETLGIVLAHKADMLAEAEAKLTAEQDRIKRLNAL